MMSSQLRRALGVIWLVAAAGVAARLLTSSDRWGAVALLGAAAVIAGLVRRHRWRARRDP